MLKRVAVIGAGSWGTALAAQVLSKNFADVTLWCRRQELAAEINLARENAVYLPGVAIPKHVVATASLAEAVSDKDLLVFSVPSAHLRRVLQQVVPLLQRPTWVLNTAKGFEPETLQRLSQVIRQEMGQLAAEVAVLSGPNHAEEVGKAMPSASVIACGDVDHAMRLQDAFFTPTFRVYTNRDVVGVELGGAVKNVIALAAGVLDGMGFGDNTKAMLMTRGLLEMVRLGQALGADWRTFSGLSGIGDLIATCTSRHSRNWTAGYRIGQGTPLDEVFGATQMVIEGVFATQATHKLASQIGVDMPVTAALHGVLFEEADLQTQMEQMMNRLKKHEYEDLPFNP